jgi:1-acyl-sn-glycerol-3-phosphate acyltransferase
LQTYLKSNILHSMKKAINKIFRWILWNILSRVFVIFYLRPLYNYRRTADSDRIPKPTFILVANHGTFFDPWMVGTYSFTPVNYMTNDDGFRASPTTQWYLRNIGAFPKKKGAADVKAMKETLRRLGHKEPVCIFPEGQTTWDGETQLIYKGIEKLIKKAGCPLVMMRLRGNFLTRPWWAQSIRKGRILIAIKILLKDHIATMSDDALFDAIKSHIYQNDIKDPDNAKIPFSGKNVAQGLDRFVWMCQQCGAEDSLAMKGDTITCEACKRSWLFDAHCHIKAIGSDSKFSTDLKDWAEEHKNKVKAKVKNAKSGEVLTQSGNVMLQVINKNGYSFDDQSTGNLQLTSEKLAFASIGNPNHNLVFNITEIKDCVIQKKDIFEFRVNEVYYRFVFNHHSPMKWIYYLRYLHNFEEYEKRGYL